MNWFKENKFLGILIAVTLVLAILIAVIGMGASGEADKTAEAIKTKKSAISRLEGGKPYPSAANLKDKKGNLKSVLEKASEARNLLLEYRPENLENTNASAFTALFDKTEKNLRELYQSKDIALPEDWHVGFEKYKSSPVDQENTGILSYEMNAMDWLFKTVAEAGASEVTAFYREALPPEEGRPWVSADEGADTQKNSGRRRTPKGSKAAASKPVAKSLPFEISLKGREESLRHILAELSNSQEYFVVVRALRVQNEKMTPPNRQQVGFKEAEAEGGGNAFGNGFDGGFSFPEGGADDTPAADTEEAPAEGDAAPDGEDGSEEEATPAPDKPVDTGRILQIVAGNEKLNYFIRGELLLFDPEATLPEVK